MEIFEQLKNIEQLKSELEKSRSILAASIAEELTKNGPISLSKEKAKDIEGMVTTTYSTYQDSHPTKIGVIDSLSIEDGIVSVGIRPSENPRSVVFVDMDFIEEPEQVAKFIIANRGA